MTELRYRIADAAYGARQTLARILLAGTVGDGTGRLTGRPARRIVWAFRLAR